MTIDQFSLRGNYPNFRIYKHFIKKHLQHEIAPDPMGYVAPIVDYKLMGSNDFGSLDLALEDVHYISNENIEQAKLYITDLLKAKAGDTVSQERIEKKRLQFLKQKEKYYQQNHFIENDFVVPSSTSKLYGIQEISHKGASLLELSQEGYPVPDFCILTSEAFPLSNKERKQHVEDAISNLEKLTNEKLGSDETPLVFAMRCAMSKYVPGLMPTYLNVGVTQNTFISLKNLYGYHVASKIYLNNLQNIYYLLYPLAEPHSFGDKISRYSFKDIYKRIQFYYDEIYKIDPRVLTDPYYQIFFFIDEVHKFYAKNRDLLQSLFVKDKSYPSLILQKMVWTVRDQNSYPGVLYSRHSRTGKGFQIESFPGIFGEDIMTGAIEAEDHEFFSRQEIHDSFPAVYHFFPKLPNLERKLESPATIEFAAESFRNMHFFALLQLNNSEMTGRATMLSAIDMYKKGLIKKERVLNLLHPYHLKQIFSESIDDSSFSAMQFFCSGVSVLPRLAVSCKIYFSAEKALQAKKEGESVCLCKEQFVPADTLVMSEVDAIASLNPAAIHVVTACLSYGVPAFLNLEEHHVKMIGNALINAQGVKVTEGDWITVSSKNKKIFLGKAKFIPARFQRYLNGEKLELLPKEEKVFLDMAQAYTEYNKIVDNLEFDEIKNLNDLIKIIRTDLKDEPFKAAKFMNSWYDANEDYYAYQVLRSSLGTHRDQHELFDLLSSDRKIAFFRKAIQLCAEQNIWGYMAGSFMLGRFISNLQPVLLWKSLSATEIVFLLNEYILFEKYLYLLHEVGERNLNKAKTLLNDSGLARVDISLTNLKLFTPLKLSKPDWSQITNSLSKEADKLIIELIETLQKPYGFFYDYSQAWSLDKLKKLCEMENVAVPEEVEV
ncbi:MAG: hypothetical protein K9H64_01980 [Bacteroidales bacterium]|nr:hypothetical protein [Bacteroidales bacterium]MCF8454685.1 hypothetical protein [Bacteroidales bacterium]